MYPVAYDKSNSLWPAKKWDAHRQRVGGGGVGGNLPFLKVFIAQIASSLRMWNEGAKAWS